MARPTTLSIFRKPRPQAPAADRPDFRIAAIDVGSNSLHMVVAQVDADGSVTTLWRMKEMVGLGRISFPSRRLSSRIAFLLSATTNSTLPPPMSMIRCGPLVSGQVCRTPR